LNRTLGPPQAATNEAPQFVKLLGLVPDRGVARLDEACAEALEAGIANGNVIKAIVAPSAADPAHAS
jgi:hypothetical protein